MTKDEANAFAKKATALMLYLKNHISTYSTLVTALERGIEGMAYGTVIKMCDKLSLNPVDFSSLERDASLGAQLLENRVMQNYVKLNQTGRDKILELMDDFVQIDKYKAKAKKTK